MHIKGKYRKDYEHITIQDPAVCPLSVCVCVWACIVDMCARARKQMSELNTKCVSHSAVRFTYL